MKRILALCSCVRPDAPEDEADTWITAREMGTALSAKYAVDYISGDDRGVFDELVRLTEQSGVALNMMERSDDAGWPAILEKLRVPYTGCDAFTLMLSTHKPWMKLFAERAGMRVAKGIVCSAPDPSLPNINANANINNLEFPVIVKPAAEDASVGILQKSLCADRDCLRVRLAELSASHRGPWLVEEYIPGTDATVPLFAENGKATILPFLEVRFDNLPKGGLPILSYEAKWVKDSPLYTGHTEICPAQLPGSSVEEIISSTKALVEMLNLTGYARVDFRLDEERRPWFLEFNGNPRLSEKDCYFVKAARQVGISYFDILDRIVTIACHRSSSPSM